MPLHYAEALCSRVESCDPERFGETWVDYEACVAETGAVQEALASELEDCDYDPWLAGRCVRGLRRTACEVLDEAPWEESCDGIWTCE